MNAEAKTEVIESLRDRLGRAKIAIVAGHSVASPCSRGDIGVCVTLLLTHAAVSAIVK